MILSESPEPSDVKQDAKKVDHKGICALLNQHFYYYYYSPFVFLINICFIDGMLLFDL